MLGMVLAADVRTCSTPSASRWESIASQSSTSRAKWPEAMVDGRSVSVKWISPLPRRSCRSTSRGRTQRFREVDLAAAEAQLQLPLVQRRAAVEELLTEHL